MRQLSFIKRLNWMPYRGKTFQFILVLVRWDPLALGQQHPSPFLFQNSTSSFSGDVGPQLSTIHIQITACSCKEKFQPTATSSQALSNKRSKWKALIDSQQQNLIHFDSSNSIPHQWEEERLGDHSPCAGIDHLSSPAARSSSSPAVLWESWTI